MTTLPSLSKLYETAGGTLIARADVSGTAFSGIVRDETVHYIVALPDPCRFGPSAEAWDVEVLEFIVGGY